MAANGGKTPHHGAESTMRGATKIAVWAAASLCIVVLASIGVYAYYRPAPEDKQLAELRSIEAQIETIRRSEDPQPDDALVIEALSAVHEEIFKALPDEKQAQRREEQDEKRDQQRDEWLAPRLETFFAMPPEQRVAALDKMIDNSEQWQRAFQGNGGDGPRGGQGGGPGGANNRERGPGGPEGRGAEARGPDVRGPGGRGGPEGRGWGRGGANATPEMRKERERRRLSRTTPDYRAQRTEFVRMVQQRREERGLPPASYRQLFGAFRQLSASGEATPGGSEASPRS